MCVGKLQALAAELAGQRLSMQYACLLAHQGTSAHGIAGTGRP